MRSDKGAKRKTYNNAWRAMQKKLRDLKKTMNGVPVPERAARPQKERRADARNKLLPKDRICPECGELKVRSGQWVLEYEQESWEKPWEKPVRVFKRAVCLACFRKG